MTTVVDLLHNDIIGRPEIQVGIPRLAVVIDVEDELSRPHQSRECRRLTNLKK